MLAASYAVERGLTVRALVPDFIRFPVDAVERRDVFLVVEAVAVVVGWGGWDATVIRVREMGERQSVPLHILGSPQQQPTAV